MIRNLISVFLILMSIALTYGLDIQSASNFNASVSNTTNVVNSAMLSIIPTFSSFGKALTAETARQFGYGAVVGYISGFCFKKVGI